MATDPELSQRVDERVREWSVVVTEAIETPSAFVGFGFHGAQPVVLKVVRTQGEEWHSGAVVAAFEGRGMVRALEHMPGALLLERVHPGTPLVTVSLNGDDEKATDILAELLDVMTPRAPFEPCQGVRDWGKRFDRHIASGSLEIPADLVREAAGVFRELCDSQTRPRLLHGDLHHYNILFDTNRAS